MEIIDESEVYHIVHYIHTLHKSDNIENLLNIVLYLKNEVRLSTIAQLKILQYLPEK